ncbi:MAG: hypothetical protein J1E43_01625 [Christensenellaceae bacterium]|nr:hypothetical protein [Christensenellaceae bacterium]
MEQYLRKNRFGTWMDDLGLRVLIQLLALGWFVWLWGLALPSVTAGMALGVMGQMALTLYRRCTVVRRERALRYRLGGEMMLEDMLLAPARQAHFQAALLLGERYPLTMLRVTDDGMLCRYRDETLLIACLRMPPECELSVGDLAACQRACREQGASRGVVCPLGKVTPKIAARAEQGRVPLRVIRRETLLDLAGQCSPATDEQLIELGRRRRRPAASGGWLNSLLRRDKAARYMLYGTALMLLYVLTGSPMYPGPGAVCLTLGVFSRCGTGEESVL